MDINKLRIVLADDHAVIREGLRALINAQPDMEVIGEAGDGRIAWQKAAQLKPDLIIMDFTMPDMNGAQATERLKRDHPQIKILALTAHENRGFLQQLLQAGASGYLLKRAASEELIRAIRTVVTGATYLDSEMAGKVVDGYVNKQGIEDFTRRSRLSEREEEVLRLIAWGHGNKEIAAQLKISVKTVEAHKAKVMEKLELKSRVDIVRYALHRGWLEDE